MQRFFLFVLMLGLLAMPALAQDEAADLLSGYKLGKFHATSTLLAADLVYIDALVQELRIAEITDENYASGVIDDEDVFSAQMGLAYAIWRVQFMIQPACEAGLEEEAFTHPALDLFKEPAQAMLSEIQQLCDEFLAAESDDFSYLVAFNDALVAGEYAEGLFLMAADAQQLAGDEE